MNYYIGDLHLFSDSQLSGSKRDFDNRPFESIDEMHEKIIERWNTVVQQTDKVYILGDIGRRGGRTDQIELISRCRGRKILIRGNHDDTNDVRYQQLFEEICDYKEIKDYANAKSYHLVLCHYPILIWNGQHRGSILIYGHTHCSSEDMIFQESLNRLKQLASFSEKHKGRENCLAYNVGCMQPVMNYTPRTLQELMGEALWDTFTESELPS